MTAKQFYRKLAASYKIEGESSEVIQEKLLRYDPDDLQTLFDLFTDKYLPSKNNGVVWGNIYHCAKEAGIYPTANFVGWYNCECGVSYSLLYRRCPLCNNLYKKGTDKGSQFPDNYIDYKEPEQEKELYSLNEMFKNKLLTIVKTNDIT